MLRPGFSLVGLTGLVFPNAPNSPPGCATVVVDWLAHGYTPETGYPDGTLPPSVNVPIEHLRVMGADETIAETAPAEPKKWKPKHHELSKTAPSEEESSSDDEGEEPPTEKPRLRLV
jgi:hypothetical protein